MSIHFYLCLCERQQYLATNSYFNEITSHLKLTNFSDFFLRICIWAWSQRTDKTINNKCNMMSLDHELWCVVQLLIYRAHNIYSVFNTPWRPFHIRLMRERSYSQKPKQVILRKKTRIISIVMLTAIVSLSLFLIMRKRGSAELILWEDLVYMFSDIRHVKPL